MNYLESNWSREELKAYLTLFCLNTNFSNTNQEIDFSSLEISKTALNLLLKEFNGDNDFQSIQKIYASIEKNNYSTYSLNLLFNEIIEIILSSEIKFSNLMKSILLGFERTLISAA